MLLSPKVLGPINELARAVTVVGAVEGAAVQLFMNGIPVGGAIVAGGLFVSVPLGPGALVPGRQVWATQSRAGEASAPSPFPETVSAAPSTASGLPAVVLLSGLHPCVDWILMGGLVPGATVEIHHGGQRIGSAIAEGPVAAVPTSFPQPPTVGDTLEALQTYTPPHGGRVKGPTVASLPLQGRPPGEPPPPSVQSPFECDLAVLVSGLQEGASLTVRHGSDEIDRYPFVGSPVWANLLKPARGANQLSASQRSNACGGASGFGPAAGVNPAPELPTPVIVGPVCPNAPLLKFRNLRPGAQVTVNAEKVLPGESGGAGALVGEAALGDRLRLPASTGMGRSSAVDQPPGYPHHQGLAIELWQGKWGGGSSRRAAAGHARPPWDGQARSMCPAHQREVADPRRRGRGRVRPGGFPAVQRARFRDHLGHVHRRVPPAAPGRERAGGQAGCNVGADSPLTEVGRFSGVPAPVVVGPVRIPRGGATLRGLVTGARIHVSVHPSSRPASMRSRPRCSSRCRG